MSWNFYPTPEQIALKNLELSVFALNRVHPIGAIEQTVIDADAAKALVSPIERVVAVTARCVSRADFTGDHRMLNIIQDKGLVFLRQRDLAWP